MGLTVYEVTCPSCRVVVSSPFVRAGAAVTCASCGHRYLISQTHFKHVPTPRPAPGAGASGKASSGAADPEDSSGAQDLSEVMRIEAQRERDSKFDDYDTLAPAADEPRKPVVDLPAEPEPTTTEPQAQTPKTGRGAYLLVAVGLLALGVLVLSVGLWAMNSDFSTVGANSNPEPTPPPEPVYDGPVYQGLPLVSSTALEYSPWVQPNEPYESSPQDDPDTFAADNELAPNDAGVIEYVGQVVTEGDGMIVSGELTISLINLRGTERARTTLAIALTSTEYPMQVRVPIPASLDPTSLTPVWSIAVHESSDTLVPVENVYMESQFEGSDAMAQVVLTNDTGLHLDKTDLLITAWDAQGLPLRYWHVCWPIPAVPGKVVEFYTRTAVNPSWEIDHWTVLAFAEPSAVQPEPAPSESQAD